MKYEVISPPLILKDIVRYFWTLDYDPPVRTTEVIKTLVDDSSGIIIQHYGSDGKFVNEKGRLPEAFFYGQSTHPTFTTYRGKFSITGVALEPTAIHQLTGATASQFTDQIVELGNFINREMEESLLESRGIEDTIGLITPLLINKFRERRGEALVKEALYMINKAHGIVTIPELLAQLVISERHLERVFERFVGISPKFHIRVTRFQNALRKLRERSYQKLSDVAFDTGYYDQAHFIKEIRALSGHSPGAIGDEVKELVANLELKI